MVETTLDDQKMGCNNPVVIDEKKVAVVAGTKKFSEDLVKRGIEHVEVPHNNIYQISDSGIYCSTHWVWRES